MSTWGCKGLVATKGLGAVKVGIHTRVKLVQEIRLVWSSGVWSWASVVDGTVCSSQARSTVGTSGVCIVGVAKAGTSVSVRVDSWVSLVGKVTGMRASSGVVGLSKSTVSLTETAVGVVGVSSVEGSVWGSMVISGRN
jgi:hypothetical protein